MKKQLQYTLLIFVIVIIGVFGLRFLAGEEDTWLCVNNEWVKHGNPSGAKPTSGCGEANENTNTRPTDKVTCEAKGGVWGRVGLYPEEVCNLPTKDGGKECSNGDDCEVRLCVTELTKEESEKMEAGQTVKKKGTCPKWKITVGCHLLVEDGQVDGTICID